MAYNAHIDMFYRYFSINAYIIILITFGTGRNILKKSRISHNFLCLYYRIFQEYMATRNSGLQFATIIVGQHNIFCQT